MEPEGSLPNSKVLSREEKKKKSSSSTYSKYCGNPQAHHHSHISN
jgi:hypothetical protein